MVSSGTLGRTFVSIVFLCVSVNLKTFLNSIIMSYAVVLYILFPCPALSNIIIQIEFSLQCSLPAHV